MTILWYMGVLPFSPLVSIVFAFIGSSFPIFFNGEFTQANIFIIVTHFVPLWLLRNTKLEIAPNLGVFLIYNIVLLLNGTDYISVYKYIFTHVPKTVQGYLCQRGLVKCVV